MIICRNDTSTAGRKQHRGSRLAAAIIVALSAFAGAASAGEIKVLTTNGMRGVLAELAPKFEQATGNALKVEYGAGPALKLQIEAGHAFDVAILPFDIGELTAKGAIVASSRTVLGRTGYGAAVQKSAQKPDIATVDSFRRTLLAANRVAYSADGVSEAYFLNLLKRLGIETQMASKIQAVPVAIRTMSAVASGEADLGIAGIAAMMSASDIDIVGWLPPEVQSYLVFTGGVSASSRDIAASTAFLKMLTTPTAIAVLKSAGIEPMGH
jgi:molybdate transport system substrate-binding protein